MHRGGDVTDEVRSRHRKTVALSTLASVVTIAGVIGVPTWTIFLRPALAESIAEELADTIDSKIEATVTERLAPVNQGLKAVILGNIMALEEDIRRLAYIRDFTDGWTEELEIELLRKENSLMTQREAMAAILQAESR